MKFTTWLHQLFASPPPTPDAAQAEPAATAGEVQRLRMDLAERDRTIAALKATVARERDGATSHVEARVAAVMSPLMEEVAAPVAQLHTQAHLLRDEGKPVRAEDILVVAERLTRALESHGLTTEGAWGATVPFDPNRHAPLSAGAAIRPGDPVVVRFVGVRYQGALVRKAGVAPATE